MPQNTDLKLQYCTHVCNISPEFLSLNICAICDIVAKKKRHNCTKKIKKENITTKLCNIQGINNTDLKLQYGMY